MKQNIIDTAIGRAAIKTRDRLEIVKAAAFKEECAGMIANDWVATFLLTKLCLSNRTFIDIGAHIGSIISEVSHFDSTIKIIAVEAMPDKAKNLRKKFPSVELHECAVGESDEGEIPFYVNTKQSGYSSLGKPSEDSESETIEIKVLIRRLDSLVSYDDIDVIKIDVEGAELGVLRGSKSILANNRPVIMFESAPLQGDGLGYTKDDMWDYLSSHNYEVFVPNRVAHNGPGLSKEGFSESHVFPSRTTNYFAVPIERRLEIRDRARNMLGIEPSA
jgi:FkbM family methyltransferase